MNTNIAYTDTGFFSKLITDYIAGNEAVKPFYRHDVHAEGVKEAMQSRNYFPGFREELVEVLQEQYQNVLVNNVVNENIELLRKNNAYTITTAHQPNIFTGPLYFIYKILHVVKIARELKKLFPENNFVPVYYMGSEDADLEELNNITVQGKKYIWQTAQTGAVGKMLVDDKLILLIDELHGQIGVNTFGAEWTELLKSCYTKNKTIQQATFELIHHLFGKYGLIVLIPDNAELKKTFQPVVEKELLEQFSEKEVTKTAAALLDSGYQMQASGREINLFYLKENIRERIILQNNMYAVNNAEITFSKEEILNELENHPERFSANVVLRGVFQETILPNIIFVGGGGELAYWLELKSVFDRVGVPYPMLVLRNSFMLLNPAQQQTIDKLNISTTQLFLQPFEILDIINQKKNNVIDISGEIEKIAEVYKQIQNKTTTSATSLSQHTEALSVNAKNRLHKLQTKINRAQRNTLEAESRQISKLKNQLFPNNSLQERVENIAYIYSLLGKDIFDILLNNSLSLQQKFTVLTVTNNSN